MSTNNEVALRLALEALTKNSDRVTEIRMKADAIKALEIALSEREALAKQEQGEPVAWVDLLKDAEHIVKDKFLYKRFIDGTPLANDIPCWMADFAQQYTTPQQRKPLTDDEIERIWQSLPFCNWFRGKFARAIEAAHGIHPSDFKEKNT